MLLSRPQDLLSPFTSSLRSLPLLTTSPRHSLPFPLNHNRLPPLASSPLPLSTLVEQVADATASDESFDFDASFESPDLKKMQVISSPSLEVRELEELPEQWRRTKLAWLCKELPAHKASMLVRILNAQRKWIRQEDLTYLVVHCMRIRENETGFRVFCQTLILACLYLFIYFQISI